MSDKLKCPNCGEEAELEGNEIVECPECGCEGSTACCNPGGRNCLCVQCEEEQE